MSASSQQTLALSLDRVINSVDLTDVTERTVFIPGFSGTMRPELPRRTDHNWVSVRLAERVLDVYGRVTFDRRAAQFILIPWIQMSGGITTHREYRSYGYPIYTHEEDQRPARLVVFLYDKSKRRLEMVEGSRTWQVKIDSYIFGVIPVEWFIGF
jgi:hypothetical protein